MTQPIILVDTSDVAEGRLDELKATMSELAAFVEGSGTRAISYEMYLRDDERTMTVVQIHPDAASVEEQMSAAAPIFARFAPLLTMTAMDVYGQPSDGLLAMLNRKAEMLGLGRAPAIHRLEAGFDRFG